MAQVALDQMGDDVSFYDWFDLSEHDADPRELLESDDVDQVIGIIVTISENMNARREGYIHLSEFNDIFELIEKYKVNSWCSPRLRDQIATVQMAYFGLIQDLSDEWVE